MKYTISTYLGFVLALTVSIEARADTLVLTDGQTLEGVVVEDGDDVSIRLEYGTVTFARNDVKSISRGSTPLHELERREAALRAGDLRGTLSLARWAADHELAAAAHDLYRRALALDPKNADAHRALGHRLHEGRWLDEEAYLEATGHVRYGGRWVTPEEAARLDAAATARRDRAADAERTALAAKAARLAKQQARLEDRVDELEKSDKGQSPFSWPWYGYGYGYRYRTGSPTTNVTLQAGRGGIRATLRTGVRRPKLVRPRPKLTPKPR